MVLNAKIWMVLCLFIPVILAARCEDEFGVKTLKKNGLQAATAMAPTPDGGAIVVGQTDSGDNNFDIYILKVSSTGDILWSKTLGGAFEDSALEVLKAGDSSYVVIGYVYEGNTTVPVTLFKISETGACLWERTYGVENMHISAAASTSDGGFVLAGSFRDDENEKEGFATLRLSSNGEKEWQNIVAVHDNRALIRSVAETDDGDFILGGTRYDFGHFDHQAVFYKTDEFGNLVWTEEYGNEGVAEEIWSVVATDDGGFAAAGNRGIDYFGTPTPPQINKNALVIKFDESGNIEWDKMYGGEPEDSAKRITTTQDGGYVFAGMTRSYGFQNNDAWVVKLDSRGNQEWHTYHPGDANIAEAVDVEQLDDGTYVATGKIFNLLRNWDIFVMHLDGDGSI